MSGPPEVAIDAARGSQLDRHGNEGVGVLTNEQLVGFGQTLWPLTYKLYPEDDDTALTALVDHVSLVASINPEMSLLAEALMYIPHEQLKSMWAARWVDQGCPRVVIEDRFAALLMSTDAGPEVADLVVPPGRLS